jgi:hypothetical protein
MTTYSSPNRRAIRRHLLIGAIVGSVLMVGVGGWASTAELAIGIKDARSVVLSTGHQPHIELPRSFNQAVIAFLAEVEGAPIPDLGPGLPLPCGFGFGT